MSRAPLRITPGTVSAGPRGLSFQFVSDAGVIAGSIMQDALQELILFHHLDVSKDESVDALVGEIERIANAKLYAQRLDSNGELAIRMLDVLRYGGYRPVDDSAA
jgi:hypothetical protein